MTVKSSWVSAFIFNYLVIATSLTPSRPGNDIRDPWGIATGGVSASGVLPGSPINVPLPTNPMAVTSSSFELLPDKLGFKLAINYACGVTLAMESFLNQSLLSGAGVGSVPVVGGIIGGRGRQTHLGLEEDKPIQEVAKSINPIVLVGSTCIQLGGICGKYNVNNNAMSVE